MSRLSIRSTCKTGVTAPLILALLAGVPFANGFLLHDHSDHGIHSHAVMLAGLGEGGEGPTSFTIASPTGEGLTGPVAFSRLRRCVLVDQFRIV